MGDGLALEDADNGESEAEADGEGDGDPEVATDNLLLEDGEVEEEEAQLDNGNVEKVEVGKDVEVVAKVGNLVKVEGPNVAAQAGADAALDADGGHAGLDHRRQEHHVVVPAEAEVLGQELGHEALQHAYRRDDGQGDGEVRVRLGVVADGHFARRRRQVTSHLTCC